jgi:hypothetical protein
VADSWDEIHGFVALDVLLDKVVAYERRFLAALTAGHYDVLALWVAHTHVIAAADTTAYLHVTSAEVECGKTRLLEVIDPIVCKPAPLLDPSAASLYRGIDSGRIVTLLIDEIDNFLPGGKADSDAKKTILGLINGGYRRGLLVPRVTNGRDLEWFSVFGPKALTGIGELPRTLASRSLRFRMRRRRRDEPAERFRRKRVLQEAQPLGDEFAAWATDDVIATLEKADPLLPDELGDREQDVCELLVAIADLAGNGWPERARTGLVAVFKDAHDAQAAQSLGTRLLGDVRDVIGELDKITTVQLLDLLNGLDERPWGGWDDGAGLKPRNLAGLLRPFGVRSQTIRLDDAKTAKGYKRDDFEDAFARYLAPGTVTSVTTQDSSQESTDPMRHNDPSCDGSEEAANPHQQTDVTDVTDSAVREGVASRFCDVCDDPERCAATHRCADVDRQAAEWAENNPVSQSAA